MSLKHIPIAPGDIAVILDPVSEIDGYIIEQLAGNRFNVWNYNIETGDLADEALPFESLSEALRDIAEQLE